MRTNHRLHGASLDHQLAAGIAAAKGRQIEPARRLLRAITDRHPEDERGWLWLATVARDQDEQRQCLERVLDINPNHPRAHLWWRQLASGALAATRACQARRAAAPDRCCFCGGLPDRGRCKSCGCVQNFADLDAFDRESVDEDLLGAAIGRLRRAGLDLSTRRRHLELALAHLNLEQSLDALFHLRLAARIKQHRPLRNLIERLASRLEN